MVGSSSCIDKGESGATHFYLYIQRVDWHLKIKIVQMPIEATHVSSNFRSDACVIYQCFFALVLSLGLWAPHVASNSAGTV